MSDRMLSDEILLGLIKKNGGGGGGGTTNYNQLENKPQIGGVTLSGDKSASDLSLASLDSNGKVPAAQLPSYVDDVVNGYLYEDHFYEDSAHTTEITGEDGKIYVDLETNKTYRWSGLAFVEISESLALGETASTAYAGDKGKANADAIAAIKDGQTIDSFAGVESALDGVATALATKQNATDNNLETDAKTIVGAINEHEGDISSLKSGLTDLDNEVNGDATTYPYADVITIEDAVPANLAGCNVKIEPEQDLHGYDHPWVGGAGKNKFPVLLSTVKSINSSGTWTGNSYEINNVTFDFETDSEGYVTKITTTGTANSDIYFRLSQSLQLQNVVGMKFKCLTFQGGDGDSFAYVMEHDSPYVTLCKDYGYSQPIIGNTENVTGRVEICIRSGINASGFIFTPMIYSATETDATFAPYTNICPISGHTEASVQVVDDAESPTVTKTYTIALGDTIYGGTVDFDSGVMTVTHKYVDLGDFAYTKLESNFYTTSINDFKYSGDASTKYATYCISDKYKCNISGQVPKISLYYNSDYSGYRCFVSNDPNVVDMNATEFKAYITGTHICYELATPTTIQLTPQQIQLLKGQNTLTASTGDISVTVNGVSGAIGAVQEQVNELAEDVAEIKPLNYSTTEQKTGRKWIDDKDIYVKVYNLENPLTLTSQTWTDSGFDGTGIDTIVNAFGVDSNGTFFNFYAQNNVDSAGKIGFLQTRNTSVTITKFVLEYTKATT